MIPYHDDDCIRIWNRNKLTLKMTASTSNRRIGRSNHHRDKQQQDDDERRKDVRRSGCCRHRPHRCRKEHLQHDPTFASSCSKSSSPSPSTPSHPLQSSVRNPALVQFTGRRMVTGSSLIMMMVTVFAILSASAVTGLQIPDQQAYTGKVFYYRLPLTPIELESVKEIQISETTSPADASSASLPHWLMVKKSFTPHPHDVHRHRHSSSKKRDDSQLADSTDVISMIELIGIPSNSDRKMHFFHVKLVNRDGSREDDVFVLDVMDLPSSASEPAGILGSTSFFPDPHRRSGASLLPASAILQRERRDCILRIDPRFQTVDQVWNLISHLMPVKLRSMIDPEYDPGHEQREEQDAAATKKQQRQPSPQSAISSQSNPTALVQQWLTPLFTVNGYTDESGFRYQVTIDQQECDRQSPSPDVDDFESRLKHLSIVYHLIRIIRPNLVMSEEHESGKLAQASPDNDPTRNNVISSTGNPIASPTSSKNNEEQDSSSSRRKQHKHHHTTKKDQDEDDEEEDDLFSDIIAPSLRDHFSRFHDWDNDDDDSYGSSLRRKHRRHAMYESTPYESEMGFNPSMSTATLLSPSLTTTSSVISSSSASTTASPDVIRDPSPVTDKSKSDLIPSQITPSLTSVPVNAMSSTTLLPNNLLMSNDIGDRDYGMTKRLWISDLYGTPTLNPDAPTITTNRETSSIITPTSTRDLSSVSIPSTTDFASSSKPVIPAELPKVSEASTTTTSAPVTMKTTDAATTEAKVTEPEIPTTAKSPPAVTPTTESPDDDSDEDEDDEEEDSDRRKSPPTSPVTTPSVSTWPSLNSAPVVRRRIQKLSITAGSWYKFLIPEDAFYDEEDGLTRNLKLGFYLRDRSDRSHSSSGSRDVPPPDHWIQFDVENQFLYALPTEKSIGRHEFVLVAIDSEGLIAEEVLQIIVRQHRGSRGFHHIFTLSDVSWDPVKFPTLIQATEKLLSAVSIQLFGDASMAALNVQKIDNVSPDFYTISWTNDSLPTYPCPRRAIEELYYKMGNKDRPTDLGLEPTNRFRKILTANEFKVSSVGLSLSANCGQNKYSSSHPDNSDGSHLEPEVRNKIDLLQVNIGHVFSFKIPRDMFYFPSHSSDSLSLGMEMLTVEGKRLPDDGFVGFNDMTHEIYALALGDPRKDSRLFASEYLLLARDPDTGASVTDVFQIEYVHNEADRDRNSFEITMTLAPNTDEEMTLEKRIQLMHWLSSGVFADPDPSSIRVVSFRRGKYAPQYQHQQQEESSPAVTPASFSAPSASLFSSSSSPGEGKQRRDVSQSQHHSLPASAAALSPSSYAYYYEIVWTNHTDLVNLLDHPNCPAKAITEKVISKIFERDLSAVAKPFEPDYKLLHVSFRPLGGCVSYLKSHRLGQEPVAVVSLHSMDTETTTAGRRPPPPPPLSPVTASPKSLPPFNAAEDEIDREYYMTAILPALITISVMLFVAMIIVCLLVKYKKSQEKSRFEVIATRGPGDPYPNERDAFLIKGRTPVIFEQEMQQQQLLSQQQSHQTPYGFYSPVIMPPPPVTSTTSLTHPHHGLHHHGHATTATTVLQQQHSSPQPVHHQMHQSAMNVMRSLGRNATTGVAAYQSFHPSHHQQQQHQESPPIPMHQRRQPPPYYT